ncbi:hypothetical protein RIN61_18990 [Pseudomonas inefficax]|jgi:hypothetical protein|uniref:hypothetical protein n=1 Tax=Pseudomonas TaxID=286 RepID=UPI0028BD1D91|nr:hypothetical protein [Pseudomonas inefficax]WNN38277.1 hypothetical protein RIN61_18990 [Pseudomonas inefficax]
MSTPSQELNPEWVLYGFCPIDKVHQHWKNFYQAQSTNTLNNEIITTKRDLVTGERWERSSIYLGPTIHEYDTYFRSATIRRRVAKDTRIVTSRDKGMRGSTIRELSDYGPRDESTLTFVIDLDSSYLTLEYDDVSAVSWHWKKTPKLSWSGAPEDMLIFERYYAEQKKILLTRLPLLVHKLNLWIYLDFSIKDTVQWMAYTLPYEEPPAPLALPEQQIDNVNLIMSLVAKYYPIVAGGTPPSDIGFFPGIILPPLGWLYTEGGLMYPDVFVATFSNIDPNNMSNNHLGDTPEPLRAVPLATTISSTAGPQKLIATPQSAKPNWSVEQPGAGSIKTIDGVQHYQPPAPLSPNAIVNPDCKTLIPAMLKSSTRQILLPAVADILKATASIGEAHATWVSEYFAQTHYFKAAKQLGKLQLSMYYTSMTGNEVTVPLKNITWHVLAGNGKVNSQGVFTPDSEAPSPCTVILAVDVDETEADQSWYWAMTIIPHPFLEVDAMLELFSD